MKKLRYNELDELDWEYKNGCYDQPCGNEWWDEAYEDAPDDEPIEDDETGQGIFGNELNHEQRAKNDHFTCIGLGRLSGHGEKDEIIRMIFEMLEPFKDYHYEFEFFKA